MHTPHLHACTEAAGAAEVIPRVFARVIDGHKVAEELFVDTLYEMRDDINDYLSELMLTNDDVPSWAVEKLESQIKRLDRVDRIIASFDRAEQALMLADKLLVGSATDENN